MQFYRFSGTVKIKNISINVISMFTTVNITLYSVLSFLIFLLSIIPMFGTRKATIKTM